MQLGWKGGIGAHWHTMLSVAASATVAVTVDERGVSRHSTYRSMSMNMSRSRSRSMSMSMSMSRSRSRSRSRLSAVVDKTVRMRERSSNTTLHLLERLDCEVLAGDDERGEARRRKQVLSVG
jgi:hypothetical protein